MKNAENIRLLKYLTLCNIASRRKCDEMILSGKVKVDDEVVNKPFYLIIPGENKVTIAQKECKPIVEKYYVALNKPAGYTCSIEDKYAEHLAVNLISIPNVRLFSLGRLDRESNGLIIFTNDGEFANKYTHPKSNIVKTYKVKVKGRVTSYTLEMIRKGVVDKGDLLSVKEVSVLRERTTTPLLTFKLTEGKKREIRRICKQLGLEVKYLKRIMIGSLGIQGLKPGEWRHLSKKDLEKLAEKQIFN